MAWFVVVNEAVVGPLDDAQLRDLANQGLLQPEGKVSRQKDGPWVNASRVRGLFSEPLASANDSPAAASRAHASTAVESPFPNTAPPKAPGRDAWTAQDDAWGEPHGSRPVDSFSGDGQRRQEEPEREVASIGQTYSSGFFSGEGFSKTNLVLTNHRLSGIGKKYGKDHIQESFVADLRDISSIGVVYSKPLVPLVLGIIFSCTIVGLPIGIIFLLVALFNKERYAAINVQGCVYLFSLRGVDVKNVEVFLQQVFHHMRLRKEPLPDAARRGR